MAESFASFGRRVERFTAELSDDAQLHEIGRMAKVEAEKAASADLGGDPKFSGWSARLDNRYDIVGPGKLSFHPTRRSAGPWTVAQYGRNQSSGPSLRLSSIGVTGRRKRAGAMRRWNGQTSGKGTADDALAMIEPKVVKVVDQRIGRAISKTF